MFYQLPEEEVRKRIEGRKVKIAVIGLGRVGLPLASTLADASFEVIGIDISEKVVALTNDGISYFEDEIGLQDLVEKNVKNGKLRATSEVKSVEGCNLVIITVPTLITEDNEPDIEAVKSITDAIAKFSKGKMIVLESTVPPFTTRNLGKIIQERSGLKAGEDFGLAYSPERVRAPQVLKDLRTYPKIVGGINERSTFIVSEVYSTFAPSIIKMSSPETAEIEKVVENTQRDVNIALANELAKICEVYGVDVFEVIKAANSQPFCNLLSPGCGIGGHCIPMDSYYIIRDVEGKGYEPSLLKAARRINDSMPKHVVKMVKNHLGGEKVVILGLSFKPDVKAFKYSLTLRIIELLRSYDVVVHDPFLEGEKFSFKTEKDLYKAIKGTDCLLLSTAHSTYKKIDFKEVKRLMRGDLVVDGRGFFDPSEVRRSGLAYKGVGRP